jgi:hypothetical protein
MTKTGQVGRRRPLRVLFVSSEIHPLAKSGGLADVSGALPMALAGLGADMHLLLPGYPLALEKAANTSVELEIADFMGAGLTRLAAHYRPHARYGPPSLARRLPRIVHAPRRSLPG